MSALATTALRLNGAARCTRFKQILAVARQLASEALAAEGAGWSSAFAENMVCNVGNSPACLARIAAGMVQCWFCGCLG